MRYIKLILLILLPALVSAKTYKYERVTMLKQGCDYFAVDKVTETKQSGIIELNGYKLRINNKLYRLHKCRKEKMYQSKGLLFRLDYSNYGLRSVEVYSYNEVCTYYIDLLSEETKPEVSQSALRG